MAERWAHVLGASVEPGATALALDDGGVVRFVEPADGRGEGIAGFDVELDPGRATAGGHADLGGVRFSFV
jgi:hypothetical protein